MSDNEKPIYIGNGKIISIQGRESKGFKIEIDLVALNRFLNSRESGGIVRKWTDRAGEERQTLPLVAWPLKPENVTERRTHSVKVDTWKPSREPEQKPNDRPAATSAPIEQPQEGNELPF